MVRAKVTRKGSRVRLGGCGMFRLLVTAKSLAIAATLSAKRLESPEAGLKDSESF